MQITITSTHFGIIICTFIIIANLIFILRIVKDLPFNLRMSMYIYHTFIIITSVVLGMFLIKQ